MGRSDLSSEPVRLAQDLLDALERHAEPRNVEGMARYGISTAGTLGVNMPVVRALARDARSALKRDAAACHELASRLWASGVHEARIMACLIDAPALVSRAQAEAWVRDLDSWDVCDQLCGNLLWRVDFAWELPPRWCVRDETYVKRAGLVVITQLAVKAKSASDADVSGLLPLATDAAFDERNDVKKAASWALRQVGKRSPACHGLAVTAADSLLAMVPARGGTPAQAAARWVARDALRELRSPAVLARLGLGAEGESRAKP